MINTQLSVSIENHYLEPFEERIDALFRELELATKWKRPSVLWAIYSSEYVRADADNALEGRLNNLGQSAYHIKIQNQKSVDASLQVAEMTNLHNSVIFIEGLRWGTGQDDHFAYHLLNNHREYFIDHQIRVVFWLTEREAIDLAHYAPDYWELRHRVIEFVDPPRPDQISPHVLEATCRGTGEITDSLEDLDAKIALRTALLADLPSGDESTATRANLLLTLGILHWRRGEFERATQYLNSALDLSARLEDNTFESHCFKAIALVQTDLGRTEEAIKAYQNAINLSPDQIFPWNNLGHLYRKLGRHAEALAAYQKAIEQNGSDIVAWNGLGEVHHETRRYDEAAHAYLKAIETSPNDAHSWSGLGNTRMEEGRIEDALTAHQKAIEIDRRIVKSWLGLGSIYRAQGNEENACLAYRTALEMEPQNASAWSELGHLCYKKGAYDEALHSYIKSIEFNHGCCRIYSNLASIYIHKGLHSEAIPLLIKGIEISEDVAGAASLWNRLGDSYRQLEDYENAVAAYRNADSLATQTGSPQAVGSMPTSEPQAVPAEGVTETQSTQPIPESTHEDHPFQESSRTEPANPSMEFQEVTPINPEGEFADWLDGLASVMPVASAIHVTDPDLQNPAMDEHKGDFHEPDNEDGHESCESKETILSLELETSCSIDHSIEVQDSQVLSDLPDGKAGSEVLESAPNSIQSMEKEDTAMGTIFEETKTFEETIIIQEDLPHGNHAKDEDSMQMQMTINEKNAQIWNELGNIYYNTGAFDEAMHAFEMAIELDPSYGWSYNNLASIHFHNKNFTEAIPLYQKGIQLLDDHKDQAVLWNRMGDAYRRLSQHDDAVTAYQKAMELDPENVSLLTRARFSLLANLRS